ncbi:MAG: Fur family transcriptional regulator [Oscillospiraceae bacterium]
MKQVYLTEQRRRLLDFLHENPERQYKIVEIFEALSQRRDPPAKSTVYRLIKKLVEEGLVRRFVNGTSRQFLYQLVDGERCSYHLHLKCLGCGKLIHMDDEMSDLFQGKIRAINNFELDEKKTLLFGRCESCRFNPEK